MTALVHELDVVRLLRDVDGWPAGTEGTALVVHSGLVSVEPPFGFDGLNTIDVTENDVEVTWRMDVGTVEPPLRATEAA